MKGIGISMSQQLFSCVIFLSPGKLERAIRDAAAGLDAREALAAWLDANGPLVKKEVTVSASAAEWAAAGWGVGVSGHVQTSGTDYDED